MVISDACQETIVFNKIGFIGLGLIGGSIAQMIWATYKDCQLYSAGTSQDTIDYAVKNKIIDQGFLNIEDLPKDLDLVFICTPIQYITHSIERVTKHINNPNLIITDVGSIKTEIINHLPPLESGHLFIPGHPMAGSEKTGILNSNEKLLEHCTYFLVPSSDHRYHQFKSFLQTLSFNVNEMDMEKHDYLAGLASHFPYLNACLTASSGLLLTKEDRDLFKHVVSSGYLDTSRVARSDPKWGADICLYNGNNILDRLCELEHEIKVLKKLIKRKDRGGLTVYFSKIKKSQDDLLS
ncbi:prephenate dehydrogenase [Thermoproteota archaeon]